MAKSKTKANWTKIRNEYINGYISYAELAKKHKVSHSIVKTRAAKEKWYDLRQEHRDKLIQNVDKKTIEKLADRESDRLVRIQAVTDKLIDKIEALTEQLDLCLARDKRIYYQVVKDKSGNEVKVRVEEDAPKSIRLDMIDTARLKQLTGALKDLRDIQFTKQNEDEIAEGITFVEDLPDDE